MSKKRVKHQSRTFLNEKGMGNAFISTECVTYSDDGDISASVTISDCSRMITLSFPTYNGKDKKNSLKKLDTLLKELNALKAAMERAFATD